MYERLLILMMTGSSLAVAGAVMQGVFANPLASPTILGISVMGNFLIMLTLWLGSHILSLLLIPFAGFLGCFLALAFIFMIAKWLKMHATEQLLLIGIAFSTLVMSLQGAFLFALRSEWEFVQLLSEWQAGTHAFFTMRDVHLQLPLTFLGLMGACAYSEQLNLLSLGEDEAAHLGLDVSKAKWLFFSIVALLLAGSLATLGEVPFFGLIIPHIARQLIGANFKKLIPLSAIIGASTLVLLDVFINSFPNFPLSLNHLCGMIGGICFLIMLLKTAQKRLA